MGAGVVVFGIILAIGFVIRIGTTYTITNHRLHIKRGIIARKTQEARLERVQNVNTEQGVLDRILQVGTVDFDTAGTTDSDFAFRGVSHPEKVVTRRRPRRSASTPRSSAPQPCDGRVRPAVADERRLRRELDAEPLRARRPGSRARAR